MRLVKHCKEPIIFDRNRLYPDRHQHEYFKPNGLWVSDEDDFGWSHWCQSEDFMLEHLKYEYLVELEWDSKILFISTIKDLDEFHGKFGIRILPNYEKEPRWLDWSKVYPVWQGIIITPYLWERRTDYMWYYGWDCAGGCIWDLSAIRSFQPMLKKLTWKGGV